MVAMQKIVISYFTNVYAVAIVIWKIQSVSCHYYLTEDQKSSSMNNELQVFLPLLLRLKGVSKPVLCYYDSNFQAFAARLFTCQH